MKRSAVIRSTGLVGVACVAVLSAAVLGPLGAAAGAAEPTPSPSASGRAVIPTAEASPAATATVGAPKMPLPAPTGLRPVDTVPVRKQVVLRWAPVTGAAGYLVEVGTDEQWSDTPVYSTRSVATTVTLPVWLPHASYVWRVSALQQGGHGRWSVAGAFSRGWTEAPAHLDPQPDQLVVGMPEFRWTPVPGASSYELQISTVATNGDVVGGPPRVSTPGDPTQRQGEPITESCFTNRTSLTPYVSHGLKVDAPGDCVLTTLGTGETRFWRVRGLDAFVGAPIPTPVDPVTSEGVSTLPPSFVSDELDLTTCPAAPKDASATPTVGAGPKGSCEPSHPSEKGAWSSYRSVAVVGTASSTARGSLPLVATLPLSTPLCTADRVCRDFPTLSWDRAAATSAYRVYVSLDAAYSNIVSVADTTGLTWTPRVSFRDNAAGQAYYYAVQACSSDGCGPVPPRPPSLRKLSQRLTPTGPVDGALLGAGDVSLSWQSHAFALRAGAAAPASDAYAYRLQVTTADNPDFQGRLVDDEVVDGTSYVSPTKTYPNGRLIWRVQAVDASGNRLPWSAAQTFVRDTVAPTMTVTPASRAAVLGPLVVRFSEDVRGLGSSSLRLAPVGGVRMAVSGRTATLTPLGPLVPGAAYSVIPTGITDLAGNPATAAGRLRIDPVVDDASAALRYGGSWSGRSASNALGRTFRTSVPTARAGTEVSTLFAGTGISVVACLGPEAGVLEVWVDGVRVRRVDTYRAYSGCGVTVARVTGLPAGTHRVQVRGVGDRRPASRGTAVSLDAFRAS